MESVVIWEFWIFAEKKERYISLAVELGICVEAYKHCGSDIFRRQQASSSW